MSEETRQWYEMIAERYTQIEEAKADAKERGEIIINITTDRVNGELTEEDYRELLDNL